MDVSVIVRRTHRCHARGRPTWRGARHRCPRQGRVAGAGLAAPGWGGGFRRLPTHGPRAGRDGERAFKFGQVVSASTVALAHGTDDAQKTIGVITLTLITAGLLVPGSAPPFWSGPRGGHLRRVAPRPGDRAQRERRSRASAGPDRCLSMSSPRRAHPGVRRDITCQRSERDFTRRGRLSPVLFSLSVATAIRHPGRCPAERQSWLSRHLVQNQSSSRRTAADEAGWRMRPAVIIAWTPPRVSSTSGSCGPILTAPSTWCAPVTALDGSDVTSGWGVAAHR